MANLVDGLRIETVRGQDGSDLADGILDFWSSRGALDAEAGRERLDQVVCVLLDESGGIAGVNSVQEEALPLIANRRFFAYRAFLPGEAGEAADAMFNAACGVLDEQFQADRSGPVGMCVFVRPDDARLHPEAIWPATDLVYAGSAADRGQLRIRYFSNAVIVPGLPDSPTQVEWAAQEHAIGEGYRIVPLAETDAAGPDEVLEMWARERAMPEEEARRRVHEVLMLGLDPSDRVAAVSTVYKQRNPQLGMDLWYYRTFTSQDHRMGNMAIRLLWATRDHLRERFERGKDGEVPGLIMEIENQFLKAYYNTGYWMRSDFWFIGESANGAHVRVHYFPGARAPGPN